MTAFRPPIHTMTGLFTLLLIVQLFANCSKAHPDAQDDGPEAGFLTGSVKDHAGRPLEGVRVLVDHSIFFNSNISGVTNSRGTYSIDLPTGSWHAFAIQQVVYHGKTYSFYLHPDNPTGFGGEGAVRNFVWKLSGVMPPPLSGHYGGLITIDNFPGVYIEESAIDFTLTPVGPLIDGSTGEAIRCRADDGYQIKDIPIGRYRLTATYEGKPVTFRRWNSEEAFVSDYELNFEPQIAAQCDNCAKVEYNWQP